MVASVYPGDYYGDYCGDWSYYGEGCCSLSFASDVDSADDGCYYMHVKLLFENIRMWIGFISKFKYPTIHCSPCTFVYLYPTLSIIEPILH